MEVNKLTELFKQELAKRQVLERVGHISQIAGVKRYRLEEGKKDSVLSVDMKNGAGLEITVLPGRAMDISYASYKGIPLAWISKCGLSSTSYYEEPGFGWLRNFYGGLLTTCGLTYAGAPCEDEGEHLGLHGRISNIEADEVSANGEWIDNDYIMETSGKVTQARVFGENIQLRRTISMKMGENKIKIKDDIENLGFSEQPFMVIYHMNFGFPLLDKDSKLYVTSDEVTGATENAEKSKDNYNVMSGPVNGIEEVVFYHKCYGDDKDYGHCTLVNEKLNIAMMLSFNLDELPKLSEWKMMGQGEFVLGLEPCNCKTLGRSKERNDGTLRFIQPGETKHINIEVEIFEGKDAIEENLKFYK
jgi:hypothetical protein